MELSEEEKKAIEWLEKANYFSARLYAPTILNLINNYKKEIDREKQYSDFYKDLCNKQQKVIKELQKDKKVLIKNYDKVLGTFICKDKIKEKMREIMGYTFTTSEERHCQNYAYDRLKELLEGNENE